MPVRINDRLTVGGKVKALLGIGNLKLDVKSIGVDAQLQGIPLDSDGKPNIGAIVDNPELADQIHGSANIDVEASLESSFKGLNLRKGDEGYIDDFDFESRYMGIALVTVLLSI